MDSDEFYKFDFKINECEYSITLTSADKYVHEQLNEDDMYFKKYVEGLIEAKLIDFSDEIKSITRIKDSKEEQLIFEDDYRLVRASTPLQHNIIPGFLTSDAGCAESMPGPSGSTVPTLLSVEWDTTSTCFLLDKYEQFVKLVGPMKKFKNKKQMWERISKEMSSELKKIFSPSQVEIRYKTVLKRKKTAVDNNRTSGASRQEIPFEAELSKIASADDSIEPEILRSAKTFRIVEKPKKKENRVQRKGIEEVLRELHNEKEASRERRHREKIELLREIFNKT